MSRRLKYNIQNDIHFVTTNTSNRLPIFKDDRCCQILIDNLKFYRNKYQLKYFGYVIVPDHIHILIWFDLEKYPELTISKIIQGIKSYTAKEIIEYYHSRRQEPPLLSEKRIEQGLYSSRCEKNINLSRRQEPPLLLGKRIEQWLYSSRCEKNINLSRRQEPPLLSEKRIEQGLYSSRCEKNINLSRRQEPPLLSEKRIEQGLYSPRGKNHEQGLKYQIWQPSFWDYNVYSHDHFKEKLEYIHNHPIKHKLTENLADYKYCSWVNYEQQNHSVIKIETNFLLE